MELITDLKEGLELPIHQSVILFESPVDTLFPHHLEIVRIALQNALAVVVVSTLRPFSSLQVSYNHHGFDLSRIHIIDCVSKTQDFFIGEHTQVHFVETLGSLTELSIHIHAAFQMLPKPCIIVMDSVASLLLYNDAVIAMRFLHSILTKLRLGEGGCFLHEVSGSIAKEVRAEIAQISDKLMKLS